MAPTYSRFMQSCKSENAFDVLAVAKKLSAGGKRVIELEIGDSPFPSTPAAVAAGLQAIQNDHCHYAPSSGIPEFREAAADYMQREFGVQVGPQNIVAGPGAKTFQQFFCEAFLEPDDGVLVFTPHFPTYGPNIQRRQARMVLSPLKHRRDFRPNLDDVDRFLAEDPQPKAIFLNTPHNPTGGIATEQDIRKLADLIRGKNIALFSDEPYDQMVWKGKHATPLAEPGMLEQCVSAYTFSKSYSMSGWRLGFSVSSETVAGKLTLLTNTALSCVPPFTQLAGRAALSSDNAVRDERMQDFRQKVELLVERLNRLPDIDCRMPGGSFYVFPSVREICNRHGVTSHGLATYLLEAADDQMGVACLGGECFGNAGAGFLRLSTAVDRDSLVDAVDFIDQAVHRNERMAEFLDQRPEFRLERHYEAG